MTVKELKPKLDPETCAVCGRRLLQGEEVNWFIASDSSRQVVCELCVPRAERARWLREREGAPLPPPRPVRAARGGLFKRVHDFFGAVENEDAIVVEGGASPPAVPSEERFAYDEGQEGRGAARKKTVRRRTASRPAGADDAVEPRSVLAVPTGPVARLMRGIELFNESQFPRSIAGLSRSLGDPQVAVVNDSDSSVEIYVGWEIAWYSYRVDLGDATEPVEQSGRGNDSAELADVVRDWNAAADDYGRLSLRESEVNDA